MSIISKRPSALRIVGSVAMSRRERLTALLAAYSADELIARRERAPKSAELSSWNSVSMTVRIASAPSTRISATPRCVAARRRAQSLRRGCEQRAHWVAKLRGSAWAATTLVSKRERAAAASRRSCARPPFSTSVMRTWSGRRLGWPVACVVSQVSIQLPVCRIEVLELEQVDVRGEHLDAAALVRLDVGILADAPHQIRACRSARDRREPKYEISL